MSRRKKSHQTAGSANRPRLWGKHAIRAKLSREGYTSVDAHLQGSLRADRSKRLKGKTTALDPVSRCGGGIG